MAISTDGNIEKDPSQLEPTIATAEIDAGAVTGAKLATNLTKQNTGTGKNLVLDQDGDGVALEIDTEATTAAKFGLHLKSGAGCIGARFQGANSSNEILDVQRTDSGTGNIIYAYRNLGSGDTNAPLVQIINDHASDDQHSLELQNDGSGESLKILNGSCDINGQTVKKMVIGTDSQTTEGALKWDSSNHKLQVYNGSAWETVTSST